MWLVLDFTPQYLRNYSGVFIFYNCSVFLIKIPTDFLKVADEHGDNFVNIKEAGLNPKVTEKNQAILFLKSFQLRFSIS